MIFLGGLRRGTGGGTLSTGESALGLTISSGCARIGMAKPLPVSVRQAPRIICPQGAS